MNDCIFCKIVKGEIPSFKIFEDDNTLAFLDINPNTNGVTLVIPKTHTESNLVITDTDLYINALNKAKKIAGILAKKLNVERVGLAIEGSGVNHLHIKLYPFHADKNLNQLNKPMGENETRIFNEIYPGYLTTQLGPQANFEELKNLSELIRN